MNTEQISLRVMLYALREAENALADYVPKLEAQGAFMGYGHSVLKVVRSAITVAEARVRAEAEVPRSEPQTQTDGAAGTPKTPHSSGSGSG
jgi:hypothetical protein